MAVTGDTLLYQVDAGTIRSFAPDGSPPVDVVSPSDFGGVGRFWVDGDAILVLSDAGLVRRTIAGGPATTLASRTVVDALPPHGESMVKDATALYSAAQVLDSQAHISAVVVARLPLTGGPVQTLARVPVSQLAILGEQLFDMGDALWLETSEGDVFAIAKSSGAVTTLATGLNVEAGALFAPDGTSGLYGMTPDWRLMSYGFDATARSLWPSDAPDFRVTTIAVDTDGTAYAGGVIFGHDGLPEPPAYVARRPGAAQATLVHCGAYGGTQMVQLALGKTVTYAKVSSNGQWGIVRFPK
jgi:hypothetical protein